MRAEGTLKPPFFIIGNPRSGTTLLRLMLNNHGDIVVPPECGFAVWFMNDFDGWEKGVSEENWVERFTEMVSSARKIETWNIDFEELKGFLYEQSPECYAEAVSLVYVFYATRTIGKQLSRWGDKNNFYLDYISDLNELFPKCKFIHIIRDGRDVACSYKKVNKKCIDSKYAPSLPCEIGDIAVEWSKNVEKINHEIGKISTKRTLEIKYENLVSDTPKELRDVCEFIGERYDTSMIKYYQKNRKEEQEPKEFLKWKKKTTEPPSDDRVGVYRKDLSQDEVAKFDRIASPILEKYDYT